jgi:iron complex outermembrane recepter protein
MAAFAFGVDAVDLNSIPFAVIDRVEVLRDGASAIYGTDAISGVINFITKKTYKGGTITLEAIKPMKDGGKENRGSIVVGFGDLEKENVNFWLSFDKQDKDRMRALDRTFSASGIIPSKGVSGSSGTTFPGNFSQAKGLNGDSVSGNLTAPACKPPLSLVSPVNPAACIFDFSATIDVIPDVQQETVAGRFNLKLNADTVFSAEVMSTDNRNVSRVAPDPVSGVVVAPGNPAYPTGYANLDPTKSVTAGWRMVPAGNRTNESLSSAQRLVLDLTGTVANTDYRLGYFYTTSTAQDGAIDGYVNAGFVRAQVAAGKLTPFADATAAQLAIIEQAKLRGTFVVAEGTTQGLDLRVSRELFALGGGSAAMSAGVEIRKEFYKSDTDDTVVNSIPSAGRSPAHVTGSRDVKAISAELLLPFSKMLEMQLAARYDQYSDAGSTFNPKIGLRFQPMKEVILRTSYNTGFRAPTLDELYVPQTVTFASSNSNDPLLCPGGVVNRAAGGVSSRDCGQQVQRLAGGNPTLKPEKSKTFSLGFAVEPVKNFTFSADYFKIQLKDQVGTVPVESIIADPVQYAAKFVRCKELSVARQQSAPELQRCLADNLNSNAIAYLLSTNDNLGKASTSGIDFSAGYSMALGSGASLGLNWDATWVRSYLYQNTPTDVVKENVGIYSDGSPVFRWQHSFAATWSQANWSSRLAIRHKTGYYDMNLPSTVVGGPDFYQFVKPYTLVDLSFTAKPIKAVSVTAGVKNLFDTDPPFSNQSTRSQRGYDPRYTDPLGRTLFVRGSYSF